MTTSHNEISAFIWNVCDDVLRGLFKPHEYGDVILPFTVLRRLDCVIEDRKDEIISLFEEYRDQTSDPSPIIILMSHTSGGSRCFVVSFMYVSSIVWNRTP